jgi:hypothetical protein
MHGSLSMPCCAGIALTLLLSAHVYARADVMLTLASLALPCTGLASWRKRKRGSMSPSFSAM